MGTQTNLLRVLTALFFGVLIVSSVHAQDFYIKTSEKTSELSPWPLKFSYDPYSRTVVDPKTNQNKDEIYYKLRLTDTRLLQEIVEDPNTIPFNPIMPRELTTLEKGVDAILAIFTSLLVMMTHDVYDLGPEFRIMRMQGLIFFFFPVDTSFLYYRCGGKEFMIGSSDEPSEGELKNMKSLEETRDLCEMESAPTS